MKNIRADQYRLIVSALIVNNRGEFLLCHKPVGRGVFPNQWAMVGGGVDERETMEEALRREVKEEAGLAIHHIEPLFFWDDLQSKFRSGKSIGDIYMIYLVFRCVSRSNKVKLNEEHDEYRWAAAADLFQYDVNLPTRETFMRLGLL